MSQQTGTGLVFSAQRPLADAAPFSELSRNEVMAAGSRPLGAAHMVPSRVAPQQAPIQQPQQAGVPTPQAAAAAMQRPAAPPVAPVASQQQQVPANLYPASRPVQANVAAPQQQQQQQLPQQQMVACGKPERAEEKYGPAAGVGFDCSSFAASIGGAVKTRIFTIGKMVRPQSMSSADWKCELRQQVQHILQYSHPGCPGKRDGDLRRVVILGLDLVSAKNELPTTIVFKMTGAKGREYDFNTGERGLLVMPPKYEVDLESNPRRLHLHAPNVSLSAFRRFGNLRTSDLGRGIKSVTDENGKREPFSLVDISSPIVEVIRSSHETLKPTLTNVRVTENHMPVRNELIGAIQKFLRDKVSNFPGEDISRCQAGFVRSCGKLFNEKGDYGCTDSQIQYDLDQPYAVWIRLQMHYIILSNTKIGNEIGSPTASGALMMESTVAAGGQPQGQVGGGFQ